MVGSELEDRCCNHFDILVHSGLLWSRNIYVTLISIYCQRPWKKKRIELPVLTATPSVRAIGITGSSAECLHKSTRVKMVDDRTTYGTTPSISASRSSCRRRDSRACATRYTTRSTVSRSIPTPAVLLRKVRYVMQQKSLQLTEQHVPV